MIPRVRSSVFVVMQLFLQRVLMSVPNYCPPRQDENKICYSEPCLQMAEDMLETMDTSIHPCQDFYQYACGGWLNKQLLNPQRKKVTKFANSLPWALIRNFLAEAKTWSDSQAVQRAKEFYASCEKYGGSLVSDIDYYDNWLHRSYTESMINLESALIRSMRFGGHPLFEMRADPSSFTDPEKRQQRSNLYVSKPVLGMDYDRYEVLSRSKVFRDKYVTEIRKMENLLTYYLGYAPDILNYVEVELTFAMMYNNLTHKGTTVNMTLGQMDAEFGKLLNWTRFVSILTSAAEIGIRDITPQEIVIVRDPEYLHKIFDYFITLPFRAQFTYFIVRVLESLEYSAIVDHAQADPTLTTRGRTLKHRGLDCVKQTYQMFDLVVHRFLYEKNDVIRQFQSINRKIALRFAALVNSLNWMSTNTKDKIVDKAVSTETVLLFHKNAMDDSLLESYNSNIDEDNYFLLLIEARKAAFARDIKNIRRTREADPPPLTHQFIADYSRKLNKLYINPLFLHEPFFNVGYESLNFAGVGSILAQEIMRGFDTKEIGYKTDSEHGIWLADNELQTFNESVQCLVEQYNNYTYVPAGMHVNGTLTLDSNIADLTGLKIAYQAHNVYSSDGGDPFLLPGVPLTNEQTFFVKFAQMRCTKEDTEAAISAMSQTQSPDEFRVNGPLRNFREFATAFGCPADSYMNPPNKCVVW